MLRKVFAVFIPVFLLSASVALADPGVDPATVHAAAVPGATITVNKVVHTPAIPPRPDVMFLADTTGSMGPAIANVRANAGTIMTTVRAAQSDSQFGAAEYKDFNCAIDPIPYRLNQAITANTADVQTGINMWATVPGGGCDVAEAQLNALYQLATDPATGWRTGSTRIIAWFGDAPGHDPSNGHGLAQVITALQTANIRVIAVPVSGDDTAGFTAQAGQITTATSGVLLPAATAAQVANAILTGLANLPVTVTPTLGACDAALSVTLAPASQTVTSGTDATFTETIVVSTTAPQGTSITCTVNFLLNGQLQIGFTETIHVAVSDVTRPVASCAATTNPAGEKIPTAGDNPKSGQNPDGFYILSATDNADPSAQLSIADTGSTFTAGPFPSGTTIKLVQAPGITPHVSDGTGEIDYFVYLKGDLTLTATDSSGNVSAVATCKVPPPPK